MRKEPILNRGAVCKKCGSRFVAFNLRGPAPSRCGECRPRKQEPPTARQCEFCSEMFVGRGRFCGDLCRHRGRYKRLRAEAGYKHAQPTCAYCDRPITGRPRKFCSKKCTTVYHKGQLLWIPEERTCVCGTRFMARGSFQQFCSYRCSDLKEQYRAEKPRLRAPTRTAISRSGRPGQLQAARTAAAR
jgi:hypothetical protein